MISNAILRLEVGENIFNRGQKLFEENSISKISFVLLNNKLLCRSKIKDYKLKIEYSILNGHIMTCECTCPYYDNTHNKCKHLVAFTYAINNIQSNIVPKIGFAKPEEKVKLIENNLSQLNNFDTTSNDPDKQIQTVSQLTQKIKNLLEKNKDLINLEVKGEISTFSANNSGHIYFSIKDPNSLLSCVMFKWDAQKLLFEPKTGDKVVLKGNINLYEPRGNYQLVVKSMKLSGQGDLFTKYLELKNKLEKQGLFEQSHKKSIPKIPKTIGVVSSPIGAVIQDIINTVKRRFPKIKILLVPVCVQGAGCENQIAKAIEQLDKNKEIDTIIVARGGGSLEDLWCFNDENLARTIYSAKTPVISAVGHETDFTICDFVSDMRAPTPTAAAEIATPNISELIVYLVQSENQIRRSIKNNIEMKKLYLANSESSLISLFESYIKNKQSELISFEEKLNLLSAKTVLNRGYSITMTGKKIVKDINKLKKGEKIKTILSTGEIISNIEKTQPIKNKK